MYIDNSLSIQGRDYDHIEFECIVIRDDPFKRLYSINVDYHDEENAKKLQELVDSSDIIKRISCRTIKVLNPIEGCSIKQVIVDLKDFVKSKE